ncbi:hypothetical protein NLY43_12135 [Mesorhizobium sp. C416B]|uniref:hypothetical protein n=1 Tax=unclassified Mesorhizobium TaxID=325217 RepID=UPI0018DD876B|nr:MULTISPECIES: hypothetical protein [unclassified Mesorhizobium]WJI65428.1 hypothetical protein NLY43_12135 [Mesorhizobium sp. C416B]
MTSATAAKMALATTGLKPGMEVVDLCCGAAVPIATITRHVVALRRPAGGRAAPADRRRRDQLRIRRRLRATNSLLWCHAP